MIFAWISFGIILVAVLLAYIVYGSSFHPKPIENVKVHTQTNAPVLKKGQKIKVLSWNVQYMAGKNNVFFYDLIEFDGPDIMPSLKDTKTTLKEVARVIKAEDPDIILIQELDKGARRTYKQDQLKDLMNLLPKEYRCYVQTYYWKSFFVPHPKIFGSVGLTQAVISKYEIKKAKRHQLPIVPSDPITAQYYLKRCVLQAHIPVQDEEDLMACTVHLDAFAQGTNTLKKQLKKVYNLLANFDKKNLKWLIGGDFNLLMPGKSYDRLAEHQKPYYRPKSELEKLSNNYKSVPSKTEINGPDYKKWYTHFPNDPKVKALDRTIDYIFYSDNLKLKEHKIRQKDTQKISDHLPVIANFTV